VREKLAKEILRQRGAIDYGQPSVSSQRCPSCKQPFSGNVCVSCGWGSHEWWSK
jgi:hypothetical protein